MRSAKDSEGVTSIEYALLAALVAMAIIVAVIALGSAAEDLFGKISTEVTKATQ